MLIAVVAYWLQLTCFWWHYLAILYPNHSIFLEQLAHCFEIVCSWQITVDCHWLHCILFIFSIISSPSLWFWYFWEDMPAEKMPDPNHWRHSWNQQKTNPKGDWSIALKAKINCTSFSLGCASPVWCGLGKISNFWGRFVHFIGCIRQDCMHMMLLGSWGKHSLPQVLWKSLLPPNNYTRGLS